MQNEGSWIQKKKMNGPQYIATLAKHRFALSPTGNGVQSPKQMEALLVQTIPIVSRTYEILLLYLAGFLLFFCDFDLSVTRQIR